ncbi:MAG: tetratricopeptide repeat protein [Labilithrix sp.]|nr:tetratricopeptide repeat protein [Labilithrix sp.]MCW5812261.1 tetratricopeptide repeat protein [Labilithrix sp.]
MTRFRRLFFVAVACAVVAACGWDPSRPFDRESPQVNEALRVYDAGEAGSAAELLQDYLATGGCQEGNIGTPPRVRDKSNGSFDLGLALFKIAEAYGHRFGDEENDAGFLDPDLPKMRGSQVDCALRVVRAIAEDATQPAALRARARYLEGNLLFLTAAYKEAVTAYEKALELIPAMGDAGPIGAAADAQVTWDVDPIGRDAAWNRAVALRRIEDKKDASPPDSGPGDGGGENQNEDGGNDKQDQDGGDGKDDDKNKDGGKDDKDDQNKDAGKDAGGDDKKDDPNKDDPKDAGPPPPPPPPSRQSQDERILDQLENAPTVQQEAAKKQGRARKVKGTADK